MARWITTLLLTSLCLLSGSGKTYAGQAVTLAEGGSILPYGKSAAYTFDAPLDFDAAHLTLTVRMDCPRPAGSTYVLTVKMNDQIISPLINRRQSRLLNKPGSYTALNGTELTWFRFPGWRVLYAPDFAEVQGLGRDGKVVTVKDPYTMVIDVTDFILPGRRNVLVLVHTGDRLKLRSYFKESKPSLDFHLRDVAIRFVDGVEPVCAKKERDGGALRLMVDPPSPLPPSDVCKIEESGSIAIALPGMPVRVVSRFSIPGGKFNTIPTGLADEVCEDSWHPKVERSDRGAVMTSAGRYYQLRREILFEKHRLVFEDVITNLTEKDIGIRLDNQVCVQAEDVVNAYIEGDPDPAVTSRTRFENTSLVVEGEESAFGMLSLDDVYSVQGVFHYDRGVGGIRTDSFVLGPGASYTFRWALYPLAEPSYYDFINLARDDLDVNFTLPGNFAFFSPGWVVETSKEELVEWIDTLGVKILSTGVWFHRGDGSKVPCYHGDHMRQATGLQQLIKKAVAKLHRIATDVKVIIYIHTHINTDPEGPTTFPDAKVINLDGSHYVHKGYTDRIGIPFLYYYPTRRNSYLPAMKRIVDMCVDDLGADGIYWDEMAWVAPLYTYSEWDGHSADIDTQTNMLERKKSYIGLISLEAKESLIRYILEKGDTLVGNSNPVAARMRKYHFPRFVETGAGWYPARSHLFTPLSLGDHHSVRTFDDLLDDIRLKLKWGTLYYYYSKPKQPHPTITKYMFPFTPVELHAGWLLGKERIVTAERGRYTFGDDTPVAVYWFGADGRLLDKQAPETVQEGSRIVDLDLAPKEMAVIERR